MCYFKQYFKTRRDKLVQYRLHWTKKRSHFDLKSWVTGGTKIQPGIPSNWRIFESNWLDIECQIDSNIVQLLGILGRILVPPVTQLFRSKWLRFFFQCTYVNRPPKYIVPQVWSSASSSNRIWSALSLLAFQVSFIGHLFCHLNIKNKNMLPIMSL